MSKQQEPKWEVVDELPGEKKKQTPSVTPRSLFRNKILWFGLLLGALAVILIPILRVLLQNALHAWWLWLGLGVYWFWRRMQRGRAPKR